ncbi:MAG: hypothetical protein COU35_04890 [Candidatus Magasanikbacteria bacterium CG10_big_fil_rev_8_21_14_0_10_47_10]|uniref:Clp R domain-containing protein n=1 Tax=Candidatus Magasanikbacteria bacterium CG10_big_fil_rev_8_21_14_0_10_47_10 TaxID=1974652 RepID=A0A2H0TP77_9BACT|nr:MAG: hypothetical protein COU35_04890 [Candidatus Magasanikbacteria bacterium CG10_big_fil_rev_8_21_14_0_10_47_10]
MLFEKNIPLDITTCDTCKGAGYLGIHRCNTCGTMSMGRFIRGHWLYFGQPMTRYHIALRRAREWLFRIEVLAALLFVFVFWAFFFTRLYQAHRIDSIFHVAFWSAPMSGFQLLFWAGVVMFSFIVYRVTHHKKASVEVEQQSYQENNLENDAIDVVTLDWDAIKKTPKKKRIDITETFTPDASDALENAYVMADEDNAQTVTAGHIFHALLSSSDVRGIFIRLGIPVDLLQDKLETTFQKQDVDTIPVISADVQQILFHAYEYAYEARQSYVHVTELLLAAVRQSNDIQELLYVLNIDAQKLLNVIEWVRIREKLRRQYSLARGAASHKSKHGLDKAMTAIATPFLNKFSKDLTLSGIYGYLPPCVARDKEIDGIFRIIESGRQSVLLVGDTGVGKNTIIEGIVGRMVADTVPDRLNDKRMVQLNTSALLAGTTVSGAQERLLRMMSEITKSKNIILFINNLHDLIGGVGDSEGLDVSETLAQYMNSGQVLVFATTTREGYNKHITNSQIGKSVTRVDIDEMDENQAIRVLEAKVGGVEYKSRVFFSYDALAACVEFAAKFLHDQKLPESAMQLMTESASYVKSKKGEGKLVEKEDVAIIVNEKTGIPVTAIGEDESSKLLRLEEEMHKRMIGQEEAVSAVAAALRRARAEVRSSKRPIANFLFLGSTGVGKTELAKTIAEVYFGGENRMIRIDMSEFQDASGVYRLIGQPAQQGTGLLTEAVRQQPFSLILLDEMEKADPKILDLFLQVFDDGRLTDSVGRVIDFTNTIIIATSNAGTSFVQESIRNNVPMEQVTERLMRTELKQYFRPEFLNRFDGIVTFMPLTRDQVKQIAGLMIARIASDLEKNRGIDFRVTEEGLEALAVAGFDPEFGARPMRRAIQNMIEDKLADMILQNKMNRRDILEFDGRSMHILP